MKGREHSGQRKCGEQGLRDEKNEKQSVINSVVEFKEHVDTNKCFIKEGKGERRKPEGRMKGWWKGGRGAVNIWKATSYISD